MKRNHFPLIQLFVVTLLLSVLSAGLYAFQNPKQATQVPASTVDPGTVFVSGVVRAERTGAFISGVRVGTFDSFATTNTKGEFTLPLAVGNYQLILTKDGYEQQTTTVSLLKNTNKTIDVSLRKKL